MTFFGAATPSTQGTLESLEKPVRKPVSLMTADQLFCLLNRHEQHMVQQTARFAGLVLFSTGGVVVFYYPHPLWKSCQVGWNASSGGVGVDFSFRSSCNENPIPSGRDEPLRICMGFKGSSNGRGNCCLNNLMAWCWRRVFPGWLKQRERWMAMDAGGVLRMRHWNFSKTAMKTMVSCNFLNASLQKRALYVAVVGDGHEHLIDPNSRGLRTCYEDSYYIKVGWPFFLTEIPMQTRSGSFGNWSAWKLERIEHASSLIFIVDAEVVF